MMAVNYELEVIEMTKLLREAAEREILPRWGKVIARQKGEQKRFRDVVTEADIKASEYLLEKVRRKFPGSYSEEHKYPDRFETDLLWQFDPVDGTDEFCAQMADGYACHAALLKRKNLNIFFPVAGIIYLPGVDKMWYSFENGEVVFVNHGQRAIVPKISRRDLRGWIRKVDPSEKLCAFYESLGKELGLPVEIVSGGGAGASMADLLEGRTNLVVMNYNYTKEWDLAMAEPLVRARGGFICDFDGNDFEYNRPDSPGKGEPYNLRGYVASIVFSREDILSRIPKDLLVDRL